MLYIHVGKGAANIEGEGSHSIVLEVQCERTIYAGNDHQILRPTVTTIIETDSHFPRPLCRHRDDWWTGDWPMHAARVRCSFIAVWFFFRE